MGFYWNRHYLNYLRTEHTSEYYGKLGWEFVFKTYDEKEQHTEIFKYKIIK